ncbi:MAG: phosphoribosylglycinamide formyltransferase [Desulfobacterales bacterium]|nr:phosphoribosylglycinamide formyltransferase [Desulfobacterales bacterium]
MADKIKIGVLISGGGSNLQAIIDACEAGSIDGNIVFAGADNKEAKGLERAKKKNIPTFVVDYPAIIKSYKSDPGNADLPADFDFNEIAARQSLFHGAAGSEKVKIFITTRVIAEAKLIETMNQWPFDLLVLAGFMRNLTPYFIDRLNHVSGKPRIMNIHPALLPSFPGVDGYGDTFRYGCKVGGCTVHFIDYGEDSGPIIGQRAFPIERNDTLDMVKEKGLIEEWILYPECIQMFAEGRLEVISAEGRNIVKIN